MNVQSVYAPQGGMHFCMYVWFSCKGPTVPRRDTPSSSYLIFITNNVFLTFFICPSPRTHGEVERHTTQPPSSHEHTPLFLLEAAVATAVSGAAMAVTEAAVAVTWVALVVVRSKCRTPVLSGRQAYPYRPRG